MLNFNFKTENFINQKFKHKNINYKKLYLRFKSLEFSLENGKSHRLCK